MRQELIKRTTVLELIPQRTPLVMVDALYSFNETEIEAGLSVSSNNIGVVDNYMHESGIIEHMAQTVALHTGYDYFLKKQTPPTGYIGAIKKIDIYRLPKVGEELITHGKIIQEFLGVTLIELNTFCNDEKIASGEMKTVIDKTDESQS